MIEALAALGARIGAKLKYRGETIAVADGATGGLISAGLLATAGATSFYLGGGVIYSTKGRDILLALDPAELSGMKPVTESYALLQARGIRDRFSTVWGIAESGSAGPTHPFGVPAGRSCIAVVGPDHSVVRQIDTACEDRITNMEAFAIAALTLLVEQLDA